MAAFAIIMFRRLLAAGGASVDVRPMLATAYAANAVSVSVPLVRLGSRELVFAQLAQRMVSAVDMLVVHGMQEGAGPVRRTTPGRSARTAPGQSGGAAPRSRAGAPATQRPSPGRRGTPGQPRRGRGTSAGRRSLAAPGQPIITATSLLAIGQVSPSVEYSSGTSKSRRFGGVAMPSGGQRLSRRGAGHGVRGRNTAPSRKVLSVVCRGM